MKRFWYGSAFAVVVSSPWACGELHAQPVPGLGPVGSSPAFSPYLNLLRNNGTSSTLNYFGLVRPQVQTNQAILGLGYDQMQLQRQANDQLGAGLSSTGHPTQFLNLGGYFLSNNGLGGSGTGGAGGLQSGGVLRPGGGVATPAGFGAMPSGPAGGGAPR